jgi:methyl-accepting chemotaxis protein
VPLNNGLPQKPMATVKKPEQIAPEQNQSVGEKMNDVRHMLEQIAGYSGLGKSLKRERMMQEIALEISQIAEIAEQVVVNEGEDWYDKHTLSRNMKEVKSYAKDFVKLASEADMLHQRMQALYEDMGRILERYFEFHRMLLTPQKSR